MRSYTSICAFGLIRYNPVYYCTRTKKEIASVSESFWSQSVGTIPANVKHKNMSTPTMLYIIKAAVTIQMWRMNSSTPTSHSHINHSVTLYGFHICIFLFMSTLSSIITMKRSPCLNPAIKPTGVTLIVRHRRKF